MSNHGGKRVGSGRKQLPNKLKRNTPKSFFLTQSEFNYVQETIKKLRKELNLKSDIEVFLYMINYFNERSKNMKIISMMNPKGGAGKTVSAVNIAYALANREYKVLLIDSDPRGAIQLYLDIKNENTLFELIKESYENVIIPDVKKYINKKNGVDIIISNATLTKVDDYYKENASLDEELDCIENLIYLFEDYDYVIFDTEGTINNLTKAVLRVTDYIFAPTKASYIDMNGIRDLIQITEIYKQENPKLQIKKIFLVQAKENTKVFKKAKEELSVYFKNNEFTDTHIREDQNILNSMEHGLDIFSYKKSSKSSIDYKNLIDEFLESEGC